MGEGDEFGGSGSGGVLRDPFGSGAGYDWCAESDLSGRLGVLGRGGEGPDDGDGPYDGNDDDDTPLEPDPAANAPLCIDDMDECAPDCVDCVLGCYECLPECFDRCDADCVDGECFDCLEGFACDTDCVSEALAAEACADTVTCAKCDDKCDEQGGNPRGGKSVK